MIEWGKTFCALPLPKTGSDVNRNLNNGSTAKKTGLTSEFLRPKPVLMRIIAIDGDTASGKGTLAKKLAEKLGFDYLDTGLLYRAVAYIVLKNNRNINSETEAAHAAGQVNLSDLNPQILRSEDISQAASKVAVYPLVRAALLGLQRDFAHHPPSGRGAVLDGRDIGTVVCPEAEIKFYVTADATIRSQRRAKELQDNGIAAIPNQVFVDLTERDNRDRMRATAPLKIAEGALVVDTTHRNADQVLEFVLHHIKNKHPRFVQ